MTSNEDILNEIISIVRPFVDPSLELTPDFALIDSGAIDSASMINILLELEGRLGIQLGAADLTFEQFQSCRTLAGALSSK
ncbi:hypothetical protein EET67_06725 [Pseudaminobacter arsenicus]|uniref:Carrier domain-containing protein n=1 Tax=Borborobacter arsenicus TaxID=1851146 RepID=A0A432V827_9HYPH|nr:phosphopantetheine-binding protein [Pseudaminobacter arsenicus]RUM98328.1 hypothetical protein EET67_06725 [Pseudaminobacter arsenicus]